MKALKLTDMLNNTMKQSKIKKSMMHKSEKKEKPKVEDLAEEPEPVVDETKKGEDK